MRELGVVRVEKSFEALAHDLRERILDGTIAHGQTLPNEREIGDRTGLSRGSVREALRILETQGLVSTKPGRNGGRTARAPSSDFVRDSIQSFVRGRRLPFAVLLEAIEAIEPAMAALAAQHRTEDDLRRLEEIGAEMAWSDDPQAFHALNAIWHLAIARASHNPLLVAVAEALGPGLHDPHVEDFASAEIRAVVQRIHQRILDAVVAGDAEAARRRMARHVQAYRTRVEAVAPQTVILE